MSAKSGRWSTRLHWLWCGLAILLWTAPAWANSPLTPQERKMCIDVCFKQLNCAGQGSNREVLNQCAAGCEQALGMRDPFASKPWLVAHMCVRETCGASYNACIAKKMAEPTPSEKTCGAICRKRLGCNGETADPTARNACMRSCVVNLDAVGSPGHTFEVATSQCLRSKCGLDLEACVAKKLGGVNATCSDVCKKRATCAGTPTREAFAQCMPQCFQEVQDAARAPRVNAELTCMRSCGMKREECIAKRLGGQYPMCHRVCAKQLVCGGAADNTVALQQCQGACVQVMTTGAPQAQLSFQAVNSCIRKRCGEAFNGCVSAKLQVAARPTPTPTPVQPTPTPTPVTPTPTPTPTPATPTPTPVQPTPPAGPSAAEVRCEKLCQKLESCAPGGGTGCVTRCLNDRSSDAEFTAVEKCKTQRCGGGFDGCMLRRLGVSKKDRLCQPACQKELSCRSPGTPTNYPALAACANGCSRTKLQLNAARKCAARQCGADYDQCVAAASKKPPTRAEKRCMAICAKASECASFAGGEQCVDRCLNDREAKAEYKLRERCGKATCDQYEGCLLTGLKVPKEQQACIPACRHELSCKTQGGSADVFALATCAKSCKKGQAQIDAIAACAPAGCDTAYRICVESKLKAIASAAPPAKKLSPAEQKCKDTCDKMESCEPGTGGKECTARCLDRKNKKEFAARAKCSTQECGTYDACLVGKLGVPKKKLACVDACKHELSCLPPGEPRGLPQLITCARKCKHTPKMLDAIGACQVKGCGGSFKMCVAEKTGELAKAKELRAECETYCKKDGECRRGAKTDACVQRCVDKGAQSKEFVARKACASASCEAWDQCIMDGLKVAAKGRRCLEACRWDLQCARGGDQSDQVEKLASCMNSCKYSDVELSVRSDCEFEGCGSKFKMCVEKGVREAKEKPPAGPDGASASP